jgi:N-acyl-D-amino-acid deacylase
MSLVMTEASVDWALRNGAIVDGTGAPAFRGDVGVVGDRVVAVTRSGEGDLRGRREVDAEGMMVAPGFIDIHSHHDLYVTDRDPVRRFGLYLSQGVTTCVVGNCGWSMAPCPAATRPMLVNLLRSMSVPVERLPWESMDEYLRWLDGQRLLCNLAPLVGHGALRIAVLGEENRFARPDEVEHMKALLRRSLDAGCVGLSTGLMYYPGMYAHTDELVELARVAAEYDRPYASHIRGYCSTLPQAVGEAIEIAERGRVQVQISHLHAVPFFGRAAKLAGAAVQIAEQMNSLLPLPGLPSQPLGLALQAIERASERGLRIGIDAVPYTLGNTTITALFPPWANRGGRKRLLQRIANAGDRERIRRAMRRARPRWPHWDEGSWSDPYLRAIGWGPIRVLSVRSEDNRWLEGKTFEEIGRAWGMDRFDALCRLTLEEEAEVTFTFGYPARPWIEKMLDRVLRHPRVGIGADAILPLDGTPPASAYGCFPRMLGHYCRDRRLFPVEEAVRRMTGLAAETYGLQGRGTLREGSFADVVIFDPNTVGERLDPSGAPTFAAGIEYVFVNGSPMVLEGEMIRGAGPGRVLRGG